MQCQSASFTRAPVLPERQFCQSASFASLRKLAVLRVEARAAKIKEARKRRKCSRLNTSKPPAYAGYSFARSPVSQGKFASWTELVVFLSSVSRSIYTEFTKGPLCFRALNQKLLWRKRKRWKSWFWHLRSILLLPFCVCYATFVLHIKDLLLYKFCNDFPSWSQRMNIY